MELAQQRYQHEFIVCDHLIRAILLGLDFFGGNEITITWDGPNNMILLPKPSGHILTCITEFSRYPVCTTEEVNIPPRNLVVILTAVNVRPIDCNQIMNFHGRQDYKRYLTITDGYVHTREEGQEGQTGCAVLINHGKEPITIKKGETIGQLIPIRPLELQEETINSIQIQNLDNEEKIPTSER